MIKPKINQIRKLGFDVHKATVENNGKIVSESTHWSEAAVEAWMDKEISRIGKRDIKEDKHKSIAERIIAWAKGKIEEEV